MKKKTTFQLNKFAPFALFALLAACTSPPDYPIEPHIEYLSLTKDTLRRAYKGNEFTDSTSVTISFTDGDGDIGDEETNNLFIRDLRDSALLNRVTPLVPELGASNGIKGEITIRLLTTCCFYPDSLLLDICEDELASMPYDQVIYEIFIKDRAGHESNVVRTEPFFIKCSE